VQRELSERHCNHADGYAERVHVWRLVGLRLDGGSGLHRDVEQQSFGSGDLQLTNLVMMAAELDGYGVSRVW
jgi:hypothetical protein